MRRAHAMQLKIAASFDLPATAEVANMLRQQIAAILELFQASQDDIYRTQIVVSEAVSNVVRHAYSNSEGTCRVGIECNGDRLSILVSDTGRGFKNADKYALPGFEDTNGRGLFLMRSLSDSMKVDSSVNEGTRLFLEILLQPGNE